MAIAPRLKVSSAEKCLTLKRLRASEVCSRWGMCGLATFGNYNAFSFPSAGPVLREIFSCDFCLLPSVYMHSEVRPSRQITT